MTHSLSRAAPKAPLAGRFRWRSSLPPALARWSCSLLPGSNPYSPPNKKNSSLLVRNSFLGDRDFIASFIIAAYRSDDSFLVQGSTESSLSWSLPVALITPTRSREVVVFAAARFESLFTPKQKEFLTVGEKFFSRG